jgi:hypothetical protein
VVEEDPRTNRRAKVVKHQFSDRQGSAQRLPNGKMLIVSGYAARTDEVDEDGQVVWSWEPLAESPMLLATKSSNPEWRN